MVDELGKELPGLNDMLYSEGAIEVVKVGWFSDRLVQNYDLMAVYLRKPSEAARFLRKGCFCAVDYMSHLARTAGNFTSMTFFYTRPYDRAESVFRAAGGHDICAAIPTDNCRL